MVEILLIKIRIMKRRDETCLRQEGKVILGTAEMWEGEGERTTCLVISLQRLQTQPHATTFWRFGHCSSLLSTRFIISPRSSATMPAHIPSASSFTSSSTSSSFKLKNPFPFPFPFPFRRDIVPIQLISPIQTQINLKEHNSN